MEHSNAVVYTGGSQNSLNSGRGPVLGKLGTSGLYDIASGTVSLADRLTL
jgi:hypothetical protein